MVRDLYRENGAGLIQEKQCGTYNGAIRDVYRTNAGLMTEQWRTYEDQCGTFKDQCRINTRPIREYRMRVLTFRQIRCVTYKRD